MTVEAVFLGNGSIRQATTPVQMGNGIQCDYVGGGDVVTFNISGGTPGVTYETNVFNGTSWSTGQSIGFAPNNIYWVSQLGTGGAFLDAQGVHLVEFELVHNALVQEGSAWFNDSAISSVDAVDGVAYDAASGRLAVNLGTNLGDYTEVAKVSAGLVRQAGSYAFVAPYAPAIQRYAYTSGLLWSTTAGGGGSTVLWDPFTNATLTAPGLVGRQASSGANGNFELSDPYSTATYLSLNYSLVGKGSLAPNQFVWAAQILPQAPNATGGGGFAVDTFLGIPLELWFVLLVGASLLGIAAEVTRRPG